MAPIAARLHRWPRSLAVLVALTLATTASAGPRDGDPTFAALDGVRVPLALPRPQLSFSDDLALRVAAAVAPPAPKATLVGWIPSLLLAGAYAATQFALEPPEDSRWTDRNSFDSGIRRGLRGGSRSSRDDAALASDVLFGGMGAALAADWWWLREEYGLLRSVQVDTRWFLANNIATQVAKVSAGRQRPYVQPCDRDDDWVSSCDSGRNGNAGFFSGHASNAATLAGLLCARHLGRREAGLGDAFVCGGAAAGAVATGLLRIVSEHHFATDIIAGWASGAVFGYLLPSWLDYAGDPEEESALRSFAPVVGRDYYGLQFDMRF